MCIRQRITIGVLVIRRAGQSALDATRPRVVVCRSRALQRPSVRKEPPHVRSGHKGSSLRRGRSPFRDEPVDGGSQTRRHRLAGHDGGSHRRRNLHRARPFPVPRCGEAQQRTPGARPVVDGRVLDGERADALVKEMEADMSNQRPDILGGLTAYIADGTYVDVVYFASEAAAREGETEMPPEAMEQMNQTWEVTAFHDLTDPWLYSG